MTPDAEDKINPFGRGSLAGGPFTGRDPRLNSAAFIHPSLLASQHPPDRIRAASKQEPVRFEFSSRSTSFSHSENCRLCRFASSPSASRASNELINLNLESKSARLRRDLILLAAAARQPLAPSNLGATLATLKAPRRLPH